MVVGAELELCPTFITNLMNFFDFQEFYKKILVGLKFASCNQNEMVVISNKEFFNNQISTGTKKARILWREWGF